MGLVSLWTKNMIIFLNTIKWIINSAKTKEITEMLLKIASFNLQPEEKIFPLQFTFVPVFSCIKPRCSYPLCTNSFSVYGWSRKKQHAPCHCIKSMLHLFSSYSNILKHTHSKTHETTCNCKTCVLIFSTKLTLQKKFSLLTILLMHARTILYHDSIFNRMNSVDRSIVIGLPTQGTGGEGNSTVVGGGGGGGGGTAV
jgi:hypothetical protein